jgi:hypothetical protein
MTLQGQDGEPFELTGNWTEIYRREGDIGRSGWIPETRPLGTGEVNQSKHVFGHSGGFGFTNFNQKRIEFPPASLSNRIVATLAHFRRTRIRFLRVLAVIDNH